MSKQSETQDVETKFTPSIAKHYGNRAASLHGKVQSLIDDLTTNGCDSGKVNELLERALKATAGLQEAILAAAQGGRINPLEQLAEEKAAEAERAKKRAARARARRQGTTEAATG